MNEEQQMVDMDFIDLQASVAEMESQYRWAVEARKQELEMLEEKQQARKSAEQAQQVVQQLAKEIQQQVHERISAVVTECLQTVFDEPYSFRIRFDAKRGKTEASLEFSRAGVVLDDPLNEIGGGVIDVASFALRVACLMLARPKRRRLLVLDEPLKNVRGLQNRQRVRDMLEKLADDLDMQIVLNVDLDAYPEFGLGTVIEIGG